MKICSCCKVEKPLVDFNRYKRSKDGFDYRCKVCQRDSNKSWVKENWTKKLSQQAERRRELHNRVLSFKAEKGCLCCSENDPVCLDLHHLDPNEKEIDPADMSAQGWSWERMMSEIDKCVVLCANCHRKVHANVISLVL